MSIHLTNFTDERKKAVAKSLKDGATVAAAAEAVGVCRGAVYYWIHHDPEFKAFVQTYKEEMIQSVWGESYRMTQTEEYRETKTITDTEGNQREETVTRIRWASIPAIDLFLRNRDKDYVQRIQPSDSTQTTAELAAELRRHMAELDESDMMEPDDFRD